MHEDEVARIREYYAKRDGAQRSKRGAMAEASRLLVEERRTKMGALLADEGIGPESRILDVGCGTGADLQHWLVRGWSPEHLHGVDLMPERLEAARVACPQVDLRISDGGRLPFPTGSLDVATAATVFSSILDPRARKALFDEMQRVVRPGGLVVMYDFAVRKPTNRHVVAMTRPRLAELGPRPDRWIRLGPLLQLVAAARALHPKLTPLAMRLAPRTHFLALWRVGAENEASAASGS